MRCKDLSPLRRGSGHHLPSLTGLEAANAMMIRISNSSNRNVTFIFICSARRGKIKPKLVNKKQQNLTYCYCYPPAYNDNRAKFELLCASTQCLLQLMNVAPRCCYCCTTLPLSLSHRLLHLRPLRNPISAQTFFLREHRAKRCYWVSHTGRVESCMLIMHST